MSIKSPLSTICLVAWAKRASSRSIGGTLKKPGRKPNSATTSSTATACPWEPTAKSTIVLRLRAEALSSPLLSAVTTMSPALSGAPLRPTAHRSTPPKSAPSACADLNAITAAGGLLQPHHHAVGRAAAIHHGEAHEAGPLRREEQRAPSGRRRQRQAVDQHGQRSAATRHLERDRVGLAGAVVCEFEPRVVGREHDAKLRFGGSLAGKHTRPETLQRRRQLPRRGDERAFGRRW